MTDRELLRAQIIRHEGLKYSAYADSLGYLTIGVGRLIDSRMGGGISHQEAMFLLDNDLDACIADLAARFPWFERLDAPRQMALVDLRFNLGAQGLLGFAKFLLAMGRGDYPKAAEELVASRWHTQVGARALEIEHMVRTGTLYDDGPRAA